MSTNQTDRSSHYYARIFLIIEVVLLSLLLVLAFQIQTGQEQELIVQIYLLLGIGLTIVWAYVRSKLRRAPSSPPGEQARGFLAKRLWRPYLIPLIFIVIWIIFWVTGD